MLLRAASIIASSTRLMPTCSWSQLARQDATTSASLIAYFEGAAAETREAFSALASTQAASISARDAEDDTELAAGIALAVQNGVLKPLETPPVYTNIDVLGKTPDQVCDEIVAHLSAARGTAAGGCVVCICGLSGTGKGTTVAKLGEKIGPTAGWSNGNIFRSLTLLASTWCEQEGVPFDAAVLSPQNVSNWMQMIKFGRWEAEGKGWDTRIVGLGLDCFVSDIANTELKGPRTKGRIPTVAGVTQGEVVKFASDAVNQMAAGVDGAVVLLEGRQQTLDYIETPHRFCLTMSDPLLIGKRRAAQLVGAKALAACDDNGGEAGVSDAAVEDALLSALADVVAAQ